MPISNCFQNTFSFLNCESARSHSAWYRQSDLNFHDLRHEVGSRKLEAGWPLHAVSVWLGHTKLETTAKYLNVTTQYLHELNERKPLTLVRA